MRWLGALFLLLSFSTGLAGAYGDFASSGEKAVETRRISYADLRPGDLIRVSFGKKPVTITGMIVKIKGDRLSVDFSFSEDNLTGVTTVIRKDIVHLLRLPAPSVREVEEVRRTGREESETARETLLTYRQRSREAETLKTPEEEETSEELPQGLSLEQLQLLTDFPPEEGWGLAKFNDIRRKWIIYDLPPTDEERTFLEIFPLWNEAYKALLGTAAAGLGGEEVPLPFGAEIPPAQGEETLPPAEEIPPAEY